MALQREGGLLPVLLRPYRGLCCTRCRISGSESVDIFPVRAQLNCKHTTTGFEQ